MKSIWEVDTRLRDKALKLLDKTIDKDGQISESELNKAKLAIENFEACLH